MSAAIPSPGRVILGLTQLLLDPIRVGIDAQEVAGVRSVWIAGHGGRGGHGDADDEVRGDNKGATAIITAGSESIQLDCEQVGVLGIGSWGSGNEIAFQLPADPGGRDVVAAWPESDYGSPRRQGSRK